MCGLLAAGQPLPRAGSQAAPDPHWPNRGLKGREDGGNEIGKKGFPTEKKEWVFTWNHSYLLVGYF